MYLKICLMLVQLAFCLIVLKMLFDAYPGAKTNFSIPINLLNQSTHQNRIVTLLQIIFTFFIEYAFHLIPYSQFTLTNKADNGIFSSLRG